MTFQPLAAPALVLKVGHQSYKFTHRQFVNLIAAIIAVTAVTAAYLSINWWHNPDWIGYYQLFFRQGAWLTKNGRDPLFVAFLRWSTFAFGGTGYQAWRNSLFIFFCLSIAFNAFRMPSQKDLSILPIALVLLAAFMLKSLVQIRECMALIIILAGLEPVIQARRPQWTSLPFLVVAALLHNGTFGLLLVLIVSIALSIFKSDIVMKRSIHTSMLLASTLLGVLIAFYFKEHSNQIISALTQFGADTQTRFRSVALKFSYWAGEGILMLAVRQHTLQAITRDPDRTSFTYGLVLCNSLLPLLYAATATLNVLAFEAPALTGLFVRGLSTATELCLFIVLWRGQGSVLTVMLAIVVLADRLRSLILVI